MWECQWKEEKRRDAELRGRVTTYLKTLNPVPLSLRQALYGGRTEVFRHHVDLQSEEGLAKYGEGACIEYFDITYALLIA